MPGIIQASEACGFPNSAICVNLRAVARQLLAAQSCNTAVNEPLNAACFAEPHWLIIARGFDTEHWFEDSQAVGTGGILMPEPVHLRVGQRYYRFVSSTSSREAQLGGGWRIDFQNFRLIESFADEHGHSLPDAARLFLALPYEWTRVDRLVHAILEVPLKAYAGEGKRVQLKARANTPYPGTTWTPLQHRRAQQLYIPGLYVRGSRPRQQLYELAFPEPKFEYTSNRRAV
jgi:hypothetical protein